MWKAVKECNHSKKTLNTKYPGAYESIVRADRLIEFFGSKKEVRKGRTKQDAIEECKNYNSLSELMKDNQGLYTYIRRNHLQNECFKDLKKLDMHTNYTWDEILIAINASKNLTQMRNEHSSEYRAALRVPEWRHELYKRLPSRKHKSNKS